MLLKLQPSEQGFLDFHRLVRRLVAEDGFPDSKTALRAISAYERFFMLVASHQTEPLSPSQAVDLVWQRHMLDTRAYMQDCHRFAGSYIHRFKGSPPNAFERCVQILRVSGDAEWEHPSSSHTFPSTEINSDCIPCSCDLDE